MKTVIGKGGHDAMSWDQCLCCEHWIHSSSNLENGIMKPKSRLRRLPLEFRRSVPRVQETRIEARCWTTS